MTTRQQQQQQNFGDDIVRTFFKFQNELKLYHWQTKSYARHKASDQLFDNILDLTDQFIETFMGKYGKRVVLSQKPLTIRSFNETKVLLFLQQFLTFLVNIHKELPRTSHGISDLLNIRDEILGQVNQTLYLFTLR